MSFFRCKPQSEEVETTGVLIYPGLQNHIFKWSAKSLRGSNKCKHPPNQDPKIKFHIPISTISRKRLSFNSFTATHGETALAALLDKGHKANWVLGICYAHFRMLVCFFPVLGAYATQVVRGLVPIVLGRNAYVLIVRGLLVFVHPGPVHRCHGNAYCAGPGTHRPLNPTVPLK